MSFSPDGTQLGVVYSDTNSQVVFLDVATGKTVDTVALAGKPPTASAYAGESVEWIGERGWCLFGGSVIDRATRRVVWNLDLPITTRLSPRLTLPGGWITETASQRAKKLRFVALPSDEIQASLTALAGSAPAHLRPGGSVSLRINVGKLRHGTADETKQRLAEIFAERFRADEITVAEDQPLVLNVDYSESEGRTLYERQGISGPATGRSVQATKVHLKLSLVTKTGAKPFFTDEIEHDPYGVTVIGQKEANEATVRDSIFKQLLFKLSESPIPYFVPREPGLPALPGKTEVP
jgi:hypothetical protein